MRLTAIAAAVTLAAMPLAAGSIAVSHHAALSTASPYATQIGLSVLKRGGNASDAAIAVAFALAVADSDNLAGGGFLVFYEAATRSVWTLDFHAPGYVAGLAAMEKRFSKLAWKDLLAPAIRLAGEKKELAAMLQRLADKGAHDFYDGELSPRVVGQFQAAGGSISLRDLREYKPVWRAPIKISFHDYDIYSLPPPSASGLMISEELNILSGFDLKDLDAAKRIHLITESARRAALDRDRFVAEDLHATFRDIVSTEHAKRWRESINAARATPTSTLGVVAQSTFPASAKETHFSVVDAAGNIAAVTMTLDGVVGADKRLFTSVSPVIVMRRGVPWLVLGTTGGAAAPNFVLQTFLDVAVFGKSLADAVAAPRFDQQAIPDDISYESSTTPAEAIAKLREMGHGLRETVSLGDMHALMIEPDRITAVADPRHGGAAGGY
jgi:gamma-glutamyltranspeptidase / glutathione hydrolase